jgi:adenylate cyclase
VVEAMPRRPLPPGIGPEQVRAALAASSAVLKGIYAITAVVLVGLFAARGLRQYRQRRNLIQIRYEGGQTVRVPVGTTVLEASRMGGIPHYAVCGGRGRCSTCRVRVTSGAEALAPPGPLERLTLSRIAADPDIRLACQIRPTHPVTVMPLLAADRIRALPTGTRIATPGREQEIAVLFCDIRSFTALADRRLPFDVVFLLNRYFAVVGKAVEQSGGQLDKFIGDGAMALFGLHASKEEACRQALEAAAHILAELRHLDAELASEISGPLRVAIGIHAGPAIVGAMGYGGTMHVTAIGDTVNIASRLEAVAKQFDAALVVSESVVSLSGLDLSRFDTQTVDIRGSAKPLSVRVVPQDSALRIGQSAPGKSAA